MGSADEPGAGPGADVKGGRWVRRGLWLVAFGCLWLPVLDDPPLHSGAYVQDVRTDRATVAMITAAPETLTLTARGADAGVVTVEPGAAAAPERRHRFVLGGLQPGRRYEFVIRDADGGVRDSGSFRTAPDGDDATVRFAVVGDSGGLPWWVWLQRNLLFHLPARWDWLPTRGEVTEIGARIAAAEPDFVLHVGDVVYPWGHQAHYSAAFFRPFAQVLRSAPMYVALGNHDVMDDEGRQALANFDLPRNDVTGDERCYSFARGPLRVIVVDFSMQLPEDRITADHPARVFLERELRACTEPWIVVASHYPIFSASRQRDRADLKLEVLPLLQEHAVDLYLCGHDHTYQRFGEQGELVQVVSGGGGKSLYDVRQDPRARVVESRYHWCSVQAEGDHLRLRAYALGGDVLDTVELRKDPAGERFQRVRDLNPARAARIAALRR